VALSPDLLILGGDLTDTASYLAGPWDEFSVVGEVLDRALPASLPSLPILGNHDHGNGAKSPAWHAAFNAIARPDWPASVPACDYRFVRHVGGWRFIGMESGRDDAILDGQLDWLAAELAADSRTPTVLLIHRPLITVGNFVDSMRVTRPQAGRLIDETDCLRLVLSGHTHKAAARRRADTWHVVFPAVAYGIPDPIDWGVLVLDRAAPIAAFVKDIAGGYSVDTDGNATEVRSPNWRRLEPLAWAPPAENATR
jgi:3',5'-cyclic AMP phosphodiesterase CpdA